MPFSVAPTIVRHRGGYDFIGDNTNKKVIVYLCFNLIFFTI